MAGRQEARKAGGQTGRQGWTGLDRKVRRVRRRKLTEGLMPMPKQSKSAPLPLPAGKSRAPSLHLPCLTFFRPSLLHRPTTPLLARFARHFQPNLPFLLFFPPLLRARMTVLPSLSAPRVGSWADWIVLTWLRDGSGSGDGAVAEVGAGVCVLLCHTCLVLVLGSCLALSSPVWFCPVLSRLVQSISRSIGRAVGQGSPSVSVMGGLRSVAWGGGGSIGM